MLPAEEPVAELVVDGRAAEALGGQVVGDLLLELGGGQPVEAVRELIAVPVAR